MEYVINVFLGEGYIGEKLKDRYPVGEKRAFLLYLKDIKDEDYNWQMADEIVFDLGLEDIEFTKAGKIDRDKILNSDKIGFYDQAMETGSVIVIYSDSL